MEEVFDNDHRVVSQTGDSKGRFTFSAADSGDHRLCFTPVGATVGGGWLSSGEPRDGGIKFSLDMVIGETSKIESTDKGKIADIVQKVRDLNLRLQDIKREQVFQRVSPQPRAFVSTPSYRGVLRRVIPPSGTRSPQDNPF